MDISPSEDCESAHDSKYVYTNGIMMGNRIRILSTKSVCVLKQDGYGDLEPDGYHLKPFEALYLMSVDRIRVRLKQTQLDFSKMLEICQEHDPDIFSKYLIYRDLRVRGYVPKAGFGFGMDFRVYDRSHFGEKGSKFLIFGLVEGRREGAGSFQKKIDEMAKMGKEPVVAIIERRGEIIYYKINRMEFSVNK